ncbi:uncharacterized protein YqgC (DUF456 family) [Ereboglobus sp. PH5-5]|uniref:DUF456 domain-containing protein n=1 Tax=Ereboglobus sp. PH5-5 TaxID=2940529 RepID=UPI002405D464|nr:DUF456 domain-containing protein [Ereboglobus sp. PH5-5]MDF9832047.1 uncharacterized protein YqgC (DUF456 family) [Ereboglobus sp. PH5-5]
MQITLEILAWSALVIGLVCGPFGALIPVVPGAVLPVVGALIHKLILPDVLSWWTIVALVVCAILERVVDFLGTLVGAKWAGATRWGLFGAAVGGIVGLFFAPFGLLLGPVIGAFVAEIIFARKGLESSLKSGFGAGVGYGISMAARLAIALFMVMIVLFDLYLYYA